MADEHHLMDCFECGSCSFVCPSHIPLVQHFRAAKAAVRKVQRGGGLMANGGKTLEIRTSPHILSGNSVDTIMFNVVLALLPVTAFAVFAFGLAGLLTLSVALVSCVLTEDLICRAAGKPSTVGDWSVTITGLLYGLTLPPSLPLWMVAVGGVICVALGKALFGGLGYNTFNPALVGRAVLQAAFPVAMTSWIPGFGAGRFSSLPSSTLTLPLHRAGVRRDHQRHSARALEVRPRGDRDQRPRLGLHQRIDGRDLERAHPRRRPLSDRPQHDELADPRGDPRDRGRVQRRPASRRPDALRLAALHAVLRRLDAGRDVHGHRHGRLADDVARLLPLRGAHRRGHVVIRAWGGLPEGVMYAILLGNAVTPHLDRWIQPTVYGAKGKEAAT